MALSRAKAFATTRDVFASGHPLVEPAPIMNSGAFMGYYTGSKKRFHLDPMQLMLMGLAHSLIIYIYGEKNTGKSTFIKHLIIVMSALQAGLAASGRDQDMRSLRSLIHDRKVNLEDNPGGDPLRGEYAGVVNDFLLGDTLELTKFGRINPFDRDILGTFSEFVDMALTLVESDFNRPVRNFESSALDIAVNRMLKGNHTSTRIEDLTQFLFAPSKDDMKAYFDVSGVSDTEAAILRDPRLMSAFYEDSTRVGAALKAIVGAQYGDLFGGDRTLYELRRSEILRIDWTNIAGKGGNLLETINHKLDAHALRKRLPINPDLTASDEEGSKIKNLPHAAAVAEKNRVRRAYPGADIFATQFSTDLDEVGEEGSAIRELAREIDNGIAIRIYGRQPAKPKIIESIRRNGFTLADALSTTIQPQGCWCIKLPDSPPQFIQHIVPPELSEYMETNRASKEGGARRRVSEMPYIQDRVELINRTWLRARAALQVDPGNYQEVRKFVQHETGETFEDPQES